MLAQWGLRADSFSRVATLQRRTELMPQCYYSAPLAISGWTFPLAQCCSWQNRIKTLYAEVKMILYAVMITV